jgi:hypothetical protein
MRISAGAAWSRRRAECLDHYLSASVSARPMLRLAPVIIATVPSILRAVIVFSSSVRFD